MVSDVQKIVFLVMTPQVLVLSAGRPTFKRIISADKIKYKGLLWDSDEKKKKNIQVLYLGSYYRGRKNIYYKDLKLIR